MCVTFISDKNFPDEDCEIIKTFIRFQKALINKNEDLLDELIDDNYILTHMSGKTQSKTDFIDEVMDSTLNYFESEIINPTVLFDSDDSASMIAEVKLTAKVYGSGGTWTLDSVVDFKKVSGKWILGGWSN